MLALVQKLIVQSAAGSIVQTGSSAAGWRAKRPSVADQICGSDSNSAESRKRKLTVGGNQPSAGRRTFIAELFS